VNCANVPVLLLGPNREYQVPVREVKEKLRNPPTELRQDRELQLLALMLLEVNINEANMALEWGERLLNAGKSSDLLLQKLGNWEIYTESDEQEFDSLTTTALTRISADFQILCATKDSENTGFISYEAFYAILESLGVHFAPKHQHYLSLLFYSKDQSLDTVPYMALVDAYVSKEEDCEEVLKEVAGALVQTDQHPRDVFLFDIQGFIRLADLELACKHLNIALSTLALESLIRSLQSSLTSSPCIHIKDLESALEPFGVSIPQYKLTSTGHFDQGSSRKSSSEGVNE